VLSLRAGTSGGQAHGNYGRTGWHAAAEQSCAQGRKLQKLRVLLRPMACRFTVCPAPLLPCATAARTVRPVGSSCSTGRLLTFSSCSVGWHVQPLRSLAAVQAIESPHTAPRCAHVRRRQPGGLPAPAAGCCMPLRSHLSFANRPVLCCRRQPGGLPAADVPSAV